MRLIQSLLLLLLVSLLAACASMSNEQDLLNRNQYAWSKAIRWAEFESAMNLLDPLKREDHALTDVEMARYKQVQISHYRDLASRPGEDEHSAQREIEIGVINRHTMAERTMRYTERWRYDAAAKSWWIEGGLPDFWAGE